MHWNIEILLGGKCKSGAPDIFWKVSCHYTKYNFTKGQGVSPTWESCLLLLGWNHSRHNELSFHERPLDTSPLNTHRDFDGSENEQLWLLWAIRSFVEAADPAHSARRRQESRKPTLLLLVTRSCLTDRETHAALVKISLKGRAGAFGLLEGQTGRTQESCPQTGPHFSGEPQRKITGRCPTIVGITLHLLNVNCTERDVTIFWSGHPFVSSAGTDETRKAKINSCYLWGVLWPF